LRRSSTVSATATANPVIFSIHAHEQGSWLTEFAHQVIDAGADVFFAHGPHHMLGIEIYKGRPIFYGLGDFVFQPHRIERFPSELYEAMGLGEDAGVEDARRAFTAAREFYSEREPWEAVAAVLRFKEGVLREVRLLPLDLGFTEPLPVRDQARLADDVSLGKPRRADGVVGRRIIDQVEKISRRYGTVIRYLEGENAGVIDLAPYQGPADEG
jgi:poly-gamma-glutamate synthesis protein (capsule biosynthesis protein)